MGHGYCSIADYLAGVYMGHGCLWTQCTVCAAVN